MGDKNTRSLLIEGMRFRGRAIVSAKERKAQQRDNRRMLAVAVALVAVAFVIGMMRCQLVLPESVSPAAIEQSARKVLDDL